MFKKHMSRAALSCCKMKYESHVVKHNIITFYISKNNKIYKRNSYNCYKFSQYILTLYVSDSCLVISAHAVVTAIA